MPNDDPTLPAQEQFAWLGSGCLDFIVQRIPHFSPMPKPRRRRRFFALEGRFEVGDSGELEGIVDPARIDPAESSVLADEEDAAASGVDPRQSGSPEAAGVDGSTQEEDLPPAFRLNRSPSNQPAQKHSFSRWSVLLSLLCLAAGVLAGRLWPQPTQKPAGTDLTGGVQKAPISLTPADQSDLDEAYAARHANKYAEAEELFTALGRRHPDWGPVEVEMGRTLFYEGKASDAAAGLKVAVEKGWKPAEANFLLGVLNKARRSYPEAEANFARAVTIDPTEPEYYFFWGECLREEGKLLDATTKFRSALLRNQYETSTSLYRAKLWLCAIEADQGEASGVNAEVNAALALPHPPMEVFVAVAARDLQAGDFGAAAANLARARERAEETVFRYVISDPVFEPVRWKPEFADFFRFALPAPRQAEDAAAGSPAPSANATQHP